MFLKLHRPAGPLSSYIELLTYYEGFNPSHRVERLLPEGVVEIIIDLTEIDKFIYDNHSLVEKQTCKYAWISGLRKEYISISALPHSSMMIIRFRPGMAYPFLGMPVIEIRGQVVDADILLPDAAFLREQLVESVFVEQRFRVVEDYLLRQLFKNGAIPHFIPGMMDKITGNPSALALSALIDDCGFSHKHFIYLFKKYVGLPPKQFMRIMKFQGTLREIEAKEEIYWPDIAYSSGYFDQAHFIHEFKSFSGLNPTDYLQKKGPDINYIPIA